MKKIIAVLFGILLVFCLSVPAFALADAAYLNDPEGLVPTEEAEAVNAKLKEVSDRNGSDFAVYIISTLDGSSAEDMAEQIFMNDPAGYGRGKDRSGVLFLYAVKDGVWSIYVHGKGEKAFSDDACEQLVKDFSGDLKSRNYESAFAAYADGCEDLLKKSEKGSILYRLTHKPALIPVGILIALALGFLLAGIPLAKLKAEIDNVNWKSNASDYSRRGSMQVEQSDDRFLYKNTTKERVASSSSSKSGGSSGHSTSGKI